MWRGPPKLRARRRHAADPAPACLHYGALTGVQLKTAIHAMYGYVDGIKIDVADCKECVCAAAPRCAAQCTAIGLSRCCGVQRRLAAARRTPMRARPTVVWAIRLVHGTDPVQMWSLKGASSPSLGAGVSPVLVQIWQG